MLSQFIGSDSGRMLGELDFSFPEGTHAIGRLDYDSEGLLLLTTNKKVTRLLFQGEEPHQRTYLVKVAGIVTDAALEQLRTGIAIQVKDGEYYTTAPCEVAIAIPPAELLLTDVSTHPNVQFTWLTIALTEGKFHQVRKMVRTVRHRCHRLIRIAIEDIHLDKLAPGDVREINEQLFFKLLRINNWQ